MPGDPQLRIEATALVSIIVLIPLYLGIAHVSAWGAGTYAVLGGGAIALGDNVQFGLDDVRITLAEVVMWTSVVAALGGLIYLVALLFL